MDTQGNSKHSARRNERFKRESNTTERVITSSSEACSSTDKSEERQNQDDRCGVVVLISAGDATHAS